MASLLAIALVASGTIRADELSQERIDKWEPQIRKFEVQDAEQMPPAGGIVFAGSSSIRFWDLPQYFGEGAPLNRGFGGSQIIDVNHFLDRVVLKYRPRTIVFYCGDNDIAAGASGEEVAKRFARFCELVHQELPGTNIAFIAIKPSPSRWKLADEMRLANRRIREQCEASDRLTFIDIWTPMLGDDGQPRAELFKKDMLHLNDAGYQLWTKHVKAALDGLKPGKM